jgi:hypothetical protein
MRDCSKRETVKGAAEPLIEIACSMAMVAACFPALFACSKAPAMRDRIILYLK